MLADGLFTRFPEPDCCLALHDDPELPAGTIGYTPGNAMASVDSVDIIVRGVGGHGAHPHQTKDPIVLASQIVLALQTIVSREVQPGQPAVVTVGSIHGGTKHNIISEEVKLQLTIRSYREEVRNQILEAIRRIARGQALAAGVPEDRLPEVSLVEESTRATYNTPELSERVAGVIRSWLGDEKVILKPASMGGEDFNEFGRTERQIPICMFTLGGVNPEAYESAKREGRSLPSLHSSLWAPLPEPTIITGVTAMSAVAMDILKPKPTAAQ
jgi:hippurate hydrolase